MAEEVKGVEDLSVQLEAERQLRIELEDKLAVASVEKDNYKIVALKRKGKLENDENFFGDNDEKDIEASVAKQIAQTQREREVSRQIESEKLLRLKAESALAEVLRAKDNKPAGSVGGSSGGGQEVADGVFSENQIASLENKWTRMGFSEEQKKRMLDTEKKNALARRAL